MKDHFFWKVVIKVLIPASFRPVPSTLTQWCWTPIPGRWLRSPPISTSTSWAWSSWTASLAASLGRVGYRRLFISHSPSYKFSGESWWWRRTWTGGGEEDEKLEARPYGAVEFHDVQMSILWKRMLRYSAKNLYVDGPNFHSETSCWRNTKCIALEKFV